MKLTENYVLLDQNFYFFSAKTSEKEETEEKKNIGSCRRIEQRVFVDLEVTGNGWER